MSAQAGQASSPLRQLTTLAARAKHISANSVLTAPLALLSVAFGTSFRADPCGRLATA